MELVRRARTVEGEMKKKLVAKINIRSGATIVASVCEQATRSEGGRGFDVIAAKVQMWKKKRKERRGAVLRCAHSGTILQALRGAGG